MTRVEYRRMLRRYKSEPGEEGVCGICKNSLNQIMRLSRRCHLVIAVLASVVLIELLLTALSAHFVCVIHQVCNTYSGLQCIFVIGQKITNNFFWFLELPVSRISSCVLFPACSTSSGLQYIFWFLELPACGIYYL